MNDFLKLLAAVLGILLFAVLIGTLMLLKKELHDTGPEVIIIEVNRSPEYL